MFASGLLDTVGTRIDEYFRDYEIDYDDAIKHFMVEAGHHLLMKDNLSGGNLKGVHKGVAYNWFVVHADTVVVTEYPKGKQ
jgi:hypothetical protein